MFYTVFCRSDRAPTGQEVANWVMDAAAFDDIPRFDPPLEALGTTDWKAGAVIYDESKRPVQIVRHVGAECKEHVDAAVNMLRDRSYYREKADLVARLRETKQGFVIEFDELLASDEVWELLDVIEHRIASELDGVIFSEDEGFFDGKNEPLCAFT